MYLYNNLVDPLKLAKILWPHVYFYNKQKEILYSLVNNDETYAPAGNKLGKDFVAAYGVLWFFLTRKPVRIVTTSAKEDHLRVLWGEISRFIISCKYPLDVKRGGPLLINHQDIRKYVDGVKDPISYLIGMVAGQDSIAAMQGHHANPQTLEEANDGIPRTLFVSDESSSVMDQYYSMASTWMQRFLAIGNTWQCDNFWFKHIKEGDIPREDGTGFHRKIIRIRAQDSPNVRLAEAQLSKGITPTNEIIVPGVKNWKEYSNNRKLWDEIQQAVALDAEFYEGNEIRLFPKDWLDNSNQKSDSIFRSKTKRFAKAIGIDPAEGRDSTVICVIDEYGIIEMVSRKTPDTDKVYHEVKSMGLRYKVPAENWIFDRGGGGKEHADRLRAKGYNVRTISFGESVLDISPGKKSYPSKIEEREERTVYKNKRAQLYGEARIVLDPDGDYSGFGIPREYQELIRQLSLIPKLYDSEGCLYLLPKNKSSPNSKEKTLIDLIGRSPDEADAFVLAIHGLLYPASNFTIGAI